MDLLCCLFLEDYCDMCINVFPIYIYKLLIYYEKLSLFEACFDKEKDYRKSEHSDIIQAAFSYAIIIKNFSIALYILRKYSKAFCEKTEIIIDTILLIINEQNETNGAEKYQHGISNFEELLFFLKIFSDSFTATQSHKFVNLLINLYEVDSIEDEEYDHNVRGKIMKGIRENQLRKHFLVYANNPIKICVLIMDLADILSRRNSFVKKAVAYIKRLYSQAATDILYEWRFDYNKIESCVHDKTYCGEIVIDMISRNQLIDILNFKKLSLMISEMWHGRYETQSFLNYSLNYQIIKTIMLKQNVLVGYSPDFSEEMDLGYLWGKTKEYYCVWKHRNQDGYKKYRKSIKGHFFMFKIWRRSMSVRYMIDAICIIIMGMILQFVINNFADESLVWYKNNPEYYRLENELKTMSTTDPNYQTTNAEFIKLENLLLGTAENNYSLYIQTLIIFGFYLSYPVRNFFQIIFACKRKRNWGTLKGEIILSLIHMFLSFYSIIRFFAEYRHRKRESDPRYNKWEVLSASFVNEDFLDMILVAGIYIMVQWMRIIFLFKLNSFISPMLSIIFNMIRDIAKFCVIYLFILLVFVASGRLLFSEVPGMENEIDAMITLFSTTFGVFDFEMFDTPKNFLTKKHGQYFLIAYMMVSNIVLLNFVIAVISNTYTRLKDISQALYLNEIIKARNIFEYNKFYSGLVSLPPPFNLLLIPVFPFLVFMKSRKLNDVVLHISYLPVMIVGTLVFVISSFVLLPFSYIALLYQNFIDIWEKGGDGSSKCVEATQFFTMIFKAPFVLFGGIIVDSTKFIFSLYSTKIRLHNEKAAAKRYDFSSLNCEYFLLIKKILYRKKGKLVDVKNIIKELNQEFGIYTHLRNIIYKSYQSKPMKDTRDKDECNSDSDSDIEGKMNENHEIKELSSLDKIKQYNYCKRFIVSNSIPLELYHQTKRADTMCTVNDPDHESEDEGAYYMRRDNFLFPPTMNQFIKKREIKRRRVIDTTNLLKVINEMEENVYFKHINKSDLVTIDIQCEEANKKHKEQAFKLQNKDQYYKMEKLNLNHAMVVRSDFEKLEKKILDCSVDIRKKLNLCSVQANYDAMEKNLERQTKK